MVFSVYWFLQCDFKTFELSLFPFLSISSIYPPLSLLPGTDGFHACHLSYAPLSCVGSPALSSFILHSQSILLSSNRQSSLPFSSTVFCSLFNASATLFKEPFVSVMAFTNFFSFLCTLDCRLCRLLTNPLRTIRLILTMALSSTGSLSIFLLLAVLCIC